MGSSCTTQAHAASLETPSAASTLQEEDAHQSGGSRVATPTASTTKAKKRQFVSIVRSDHVPPSPAAGLTISVDSSGTSASAGQRELQEPLSTDSSSNKTARPNSQLLSTDSENLPESRYCQRVDSGSTLKTTDSNLSSSQNPPSIVNTLRPATSELTSMQSAALAQNGSDMLSPVPHPLRSSSSSSLLNRFRTPTLHSDSSRGEEQDELIGCDGPTGSNSCGGIPPRPPVMCHIPDMTFYTSPLTSPNQPHPQSRSTSAKDLPNARVPRHPSQRSNLHNRSNSKHSGSMTSSDSSPDHHNLMMSPQIELTASTEQQPHQPHTLPEWSSIRNTTRTEGGIWQHQEALVDHQPRQGSILVPCEPNSSGTFNIQ